MNGNRPLHFVTAEAYLVGMLDTQTRQLRPGFRCWFVVAA